MSLRGALKGADGGKKKNATPVWWTDKGQREENKRNKGQKKLDV